MAPRIVSIIGSRPEIVQAAPLSLAFTDCVEEILVHTGQHYDPAMSDLQIADLRLPLPEHNLGVGSLPNDESVAVAEERIARVIETRAARRGPGPRRHQRHARRRPRRRRRRRAAAARRGGPAQLPRRHARGAQPDRDRPALRPSLRALRARPRDAPRRGGPGHTSTSPATSSPTSCSRPAIACREGGEQGDYVLATAHRNYNTDSPERLGAVLGLPRGGRVPRDLPDAPPHPQEPRGLGPRGPGQRRGARRRHLHRDADASSATRSRSPPTPAASSARPTSGACPASRCARRPSGSRPSRPAGTRWSASTPRSSAPPWPSRAPTERPPIFGDGNAAERIAELTVAHPRASPGGSLV